MLESDSATSSTFDIKVYSLCGGVSELVLETGLASFIV